MADPYDRNVLPSRAIYPTRYLPYILALCIIKGLRALGIFITFDILKDCHIVHFLCIVKLGSGFLFLLLQKPFSSGKRLTKHQWFRIVRHAFFGSLIQLLWIFGLTLCGPLRTLLLYEHSDLAVVAGLGAIIYGTGGPSKLRGGVFFLVAILALLLFDVDDVTSHEPAHVHSGIFAHLLVHLTNMTGWSDHKGGVLLLVFCLCFKAGYNYAARKLAVDIGGAKRLNALSTIISGVMLLPWAIKVYFTSDSTYFQNDDGYLYYFMPFPLVILLVFVFDFYAEAVCTSRLELFRTAYFGSMATFSSAMLLSWFWAHPLLAQWVDNIREEHMLSGGVVFSFVMLMFSTHILTSPSRGTKGSFVGHTQSGLPLYNYTEDALQKTSQSIMLILKNGLRQILEDSNSRKIFYFLCVNLAFTFVEFTYGIWTNSLGLISDAFHMLFDCSALVMGLYAAVMSRWKATRMFSYGYDRVEILSGFINAIFLMVIAFFVFTAAIGRLFDPPDISTDRLLFVSVAGFVVNLIGIFAFSHGHSHGGVGHGHSHGGMGHGHSHGGGGHGHSHGSVGHGQSHGASNHGHSHGNHSNSHGSHGYEAHGHSNRYNSQSPAQGHSQGASAHNTNMQGVYLHILADTLGSVSVIISTLLIENFGLNIADPICSLFISILIFASVIPLVKETCLVLLLYTPEDLHQTLATALQKILNVEGVLSFRNEHFWRHSSTVICGTIHVQVKQDASEQQVTAQVTSILKDESIQNLTIQVEKGTFFQHMSGLGIGMDQVYQMTSNLRSLDYDTTTDFIKAI